MDSTVLEASGRGLVRSSVNPRGLSVSVLWLRARLVGGQRRCRGHGCGPVL